MNSLELHSPAKVNLALSVGAPEPARGLHPIASWMVALEFGDTLRIAKSPHHESRFDIRYAEDAPLPGVVDWPLEKDLAYRAHRLLSEQVGRRLPIDAAILKRVPTGAGLGGGSGNAAAMLVGLNRLFDLHFGEEALMGLGQQLGSDVGFQVAAVLGQPSALVGGFGERIEPTTLARPIHLVLIFPGFGCPTGPVYGAFDEGLDPGKRADEPAVRRLALGAELPPLAPFNDLAEPACRVQSRLGDILKTLREHAIPAHVTGSGSTIFALGEDAQQCQAMARTVTQVASLPTLVTRTLDE